MVRASAGVRGPGAGVQSRRAGQATLRRFSDRTAVGCATPGARAAPSTPGRRQPSRCVGRQRVRPGADRNGMAVVIPYGDVMSIEVAPAFKRPVGGYFIRTPKPAPRQGNSSASAWRADTQLGGGVFQGVPNGAAVSAALAGRVDAYADHLVGVGTSRLLPAPPAAGTLPASHAERPMMGCGVRCLCYTTICRMMTSLKDGRLSPLSRSFLWARPPAPSDTPTAMTATGPAHRPGGRRGVAAARDQACSAVARAAARRAVTGTPARIRARRSAARGSSSAPGG